MDRPAHDPARVSLKDVLPEAVLLGADDLRISGACEHSTLGGPGVLFAVVSGRRQSGVEFVREALSRGVAGLLVSRPLPDVSVPQCVVPDVRSAYARLCAALAGHPERQVQIAGVTGTNGKTTVTWMVRSILAAAGQRCGVLGTVEYFDGCRSEPAKLTTPDSFSLSAWLARMVANNTPHAAMELSSHALHQGRAAGVSLTAALVTNVTQDHFDYHGDYEAYWASKVRILELMAPGGLVGLNLDDPGSLTMRDRVPQGLRLLTFGLSPAADVAAQLLEESLVGTRFRLTIAGRSQDCSLTLVGRHNVSNCLAAAVAATAFGIPLEQIVAGLEQFRGAPGRLERIDAGQPFQVFVDYAHTDDALRRCLQALRSLTAGRVICVFGAGGDRDRTKRPLLGRAAMLADVAIITSDNPRSEDPLRIIDEIAAGFADPKAPFVEPDRGAAIRRALDLAQPGDCVLIAGKGHEQEQVIGERRIPFDDRAVARAVLWERSERRWPERRSA
jgi:UDP-N-acetylmuramoyl-L-alanyl-D-glutamate--2,6-diaminopimelate ligase